MRKGVKVKKDWHGQGMEGQGDFGERDKGEGAISGLEWVNCLDFTYTISIACLRRVRSGQ